MLPASAISCVSYFRRLGIIASGRIMSSGSDNFSCLSVHCSQRMHDHGSRFAENVAGFETPSGLGELVLLRCRACSDPLLAKVAEREGFRGVYLSGACLSASAGLPDIGLLTATEFADEARRISSATPLPLLVDADTGFGEVCNVERTVQLYEGRALRGCTSKIR